MARKRSPDFTVLVALDDRGLDVRLLHTFGARDGSILLRLRAANLGEVKRWIASAVLAGAEAGTLLSKYSLSG